MVRCRLNVVRRTRCGPRSLLAAQRAARYRRKVSQRLGSVQRCSERKVGGEGVGLRCNSPILKTYLATQTQNKCQIEQSKFLHKISGSTVTCPSTGQQRLQELPLDQLRIFRHYFFALMQASILVSIITSFKYFLNSQYCRANILLRWVSFGQMPGNGSPAFSVSKSVFW